MMLTTTATKLRRSLRDRRADAGAVRPATHKIVRTIPWPNGEERENAQHPVLARRQADVPVQRSGRADLRDRRRSRRSTSGSCRSRSRRASAGSSSARPTSLNDEPGLLHGTLHRRRIRCRTAGSWASAASTWRRRRSTSTRSARPRRSASRWRRAARSPTACSRTSAASSSGSSISQARKLVGRTEFKGRPRMSLKTSSNGKVLYIYNAGDTIDL